MQVVVLAQEGQKAQLGQCAPGLTWISEAGEFTQHAAADAFVDLTFEPQAERIALLAALLPKPVIVNSVVATAQEINASFVRINGWNTFLASPLWEAACPDEEKRQQAEAVLSLLGKKPEWLPDTPGFVTARVVSMIINEAYLALEEGVSTKEEINTAMKLGTAYPYGPFEWAAEIGVHHVVNLLAQLNQSQRRYTPAPLLVNESSGAR